MLCCFLVLTVQLTELFTVCRHDSFFAFHQINAFESGDDLVCDVSMYPDNKILVQLHRTNVLFGLDPMDAAIPTRYVCNLSCSG